MSIGPTFSAKLATCLSESTSSFRFLARANPSSAAALTSVAHTVAPSATKASAMARPMPLPAAVTTATLPFKRPAMSFSPSFSLLVFRMLQVFGYVLGHVHERAIGQRFGAVDAVAVPA